MKRKAKMGFVLKTPRRIEVRLSSLELKDMITNYVWENFKEQSGVSGKSEIKIKDWNFLYLDSDYLVIYKKEQK